MVTTIRSPTARTTKAARSQWRRRMGAIRRMAACKLGRVTPSCGRPRGAGRKVASNGRAGRVTTARGSEGSSISIPALQARSAVSVQPEDRKEERGEEDLDPDDHERGAPEREPLLGERTEAAFNPADADHRDHGQARERDQAPR